MRGHRQALPQLNGGMFLTEGGIGTTLIHHEGIEIPHFATFTLLASSEGRARLARQFRIYAENARRHRAGVIMDSNTWRASRDWGDLLGYSRADLASANREAIALLEDVRSEYETEETPIVISACMGPRGSAYSASRRLSIDEAEDYHRAQVETLAGTTADLISAMTMNEPEEAAGIVRAARAAGMPAVVSFTVETDGRLVSGMTVGQAIAAVDAATEAWPVYYMLNCAHADHFERALADEGEWIGRLRGLRSNSSNKSHAELDEATTLDEGDPDALGRQYRRIVSRFPHINVVGGCCGTDGRHARCIAEACASLYAERADD